MVDVVFLPEAEDDAAAAQDWYESERPGLGQRFQYELDAAVGRIGRNAEIYQAIYMGVRRATLRHFPYQLLFLLRHETAYVIACFHSSRDPRCWQRRAS